MLLALRHGAGVSGESEPDVNEPEAPTTTGQSQSPVCWLKAKGYSSFDCTTCTVLLLPSRQSQCCCIHSCRTDTR
eukprot:862545-Prymnesium_polylepis.1